MAMKESLRETVEEYFNGIDDNLKKYRDHPEKAVLKSMFEDVDWIQTTARKFGDAEIDARAEKVYEAIMKADQERKQNIEKNATGPVQSGVGAPQGFVSSFVNSFEKGFSRSLSENLPEAITENLEKYRASGNPEHAKNVVQMANMAVELKDPAVSKQAVVAIDQLLLMVKLNAEKSGVGAVDYAKHHGLDSIIPDLKEDAGTTSFSDGKNEVKIAKGCAIGYKATLNF